MPAEIRFAAAEDAHTIHRFICDLAEYEREPDAVEATPEGLAAQLRDPRPPFECLIAEIDGAPVGFALFFHNFSTWRGRRGLYLEDLFVSPAARGQGAGLALLRALAAVAVARGCARMEWCVLNWNTPAIDFYDALGATPMTDWTTYRLTDQALSDLAQQGAAPTPQR